MPTSALTDYFRKLKAAEPCKGWVDPLDERPRIGQHNGSVGIAGKPSQNLAELCLRNGLAARARRAASAQLPIHLTNRRWGQVINQFCDPVCLVGHSSPPSNNRTLGKEKDAIVRALRAGG